jgi:hypothetical protein
MPLSNHHGQQIILCLTYHTLGAGGTGHTKRPCNLLQPNLTQPNTNIQQHHLPTDKSNEPIIPTMARHLARIHGTEEDKVCNIRFSRLDVDEIPYLAL